MTIKRREKEKSGLIPIQADGYPLTIDYVTEKEFEKMECGIIPGAYKGFHAPNILYIYDEAAVMGEK